MTSSMTTTLLVSSLLLTGCASDPEPTAADDANVTAANLRARKLLSNQTFDFRREDEPAVKVRMRFQFVPAGTYLLDDKRPEELAPEQRMNFEMLVEYVAVDASGNILHDAAGKETVFRGDSTYFVRATNGQRKFVVFDCGSTRTQCTDSAESPATRAEFDLSADGRAITLRMPAEFGENSLGEGIGDVAGDATEIGLTEER
jgi:hypothetical protein